jgi:hypothetical protein
MSESASADEVVAADEICSEPGSDAPLFLLFEEGSFFGLEKSFVRKWFDRFSLWQQIVMVVCITWLPLAILASFQHVALGATQSRSFLKDVGIYARFFVALPILLVTPSKCRQTFQQIAQHFLKSGLVRESDRARFLAILTSTMRLRYLRGADWVWLVLAYVWSSAFLFHPAVASVIAATWRTVGPVEHRSLSLAEWYFGAVSQPVLGFVVLHFLYRLGLWWRTLWRISRLDLRLKGSHPDGGGGLMFLGLSLHPCRWPAFALAASPAGGLANVILATGASVLSFKYAIAFIAAFIAALFVGPLCFFHDQLRNTRMRAWLRYDRLAQRQLAQFEQKWIEDSRQNDLLTQPDFSAVIDFSSTVDTVHQMRPWPVQRRQLLALIAAALLPFVPVAMLEFSIKDLMVLLGPLL